MKTFLTIPVVLLLMQAGYISAGVYPKEIKSASAQTLSSGKLNVPDDVTPQYSYETLLNGTIKFTVNNNTGYSLNADIIREAVTYPQNGEILTEFSLLSGNTFSYTDDNVMPGKTYVYIFEYLLEGTASWVINFDTLTVVSTIPALGNFNLIAASYDDEYDVLHNGYSIWLDDTNIRADASDDGITGSVVFYLNGKRSVDNEYPFALFGDVRGDYKKGRLKNGDYTLMAIAYSEKNGKGISGDTATVNFSVEILYEDEKVSVYPNPVNGGNSTVSVNGKANTPVVIEMIGQSGIYRKTLYQGELDNTGALKYPLPSSDFKKGLYILSVDINGKTIRTRFIVE